MPTHEEPYRELKKTCVTATQEEKLAILRHELLRPLNLAKGVADVFSKIDPHSPTGFPEKIGTETFEYWSKLLTDSVNEMEAILDACTWDDEVSGPLKRYAPVD